MLKNHCLIQFNITTKMWEGSHNGQVLDEHETIESLALEHDFKLAM